MVALFLLVSIGTGALIVFATSSYLSRQLDNELTQTATRVDDFGRLGRRPGGDDGDDDGPHAALPGGGGSVLRLVVTDGVVATDRGREINWVPVGATTRTLTTQQIAHIESLDIGPRPSTVAFGGDIGSFRMVGYTSATTTSYTGLPVSAITDTTRQLIGLVSAGTLLGLVFVGTGGTFLVRRNLEPLRRVAGTARRVSQLSLESGEVALAERVPRADTDPNTEVGQVGLALNGMLDNVDGAFRARQRSETQVRQFVADASHELRTPLASIRGYAELSRKEKDPVPPTVTHALGRIESESLRMQGLVEDLLLLARLDAGRPLDTHPVDLSMLTIDAVSDARAASPDHIWALDLPEEPIEVPGDRARLHQVIANLLANARSHTPAGTRVTASVRRGSATEPERNDVVTIAVSDNGPGIPEQLQPIVFERFTRGDEARNRATGSSGLGLSIVAAVTSAHGGRVGVRSRPGETTMLIELPAS